MLSYARLRLGRQDFRLQRGQLASSQTGLHLIVLDDDTVDLGSERLGLRREVRQAVLTNLLLNQPQANLKLVALGLGVSPGT